MGLKLRERHDVVYREEVTPAPVLAAIMAVYAAHRWHVDTNTVMLFRYSALTFNGHQLFTFLIQLISKGMPGLLVHGPLQATLMLNLACSVAGKLPEKMSYRGIRPLVCGDPIMVDADTEDGNLVTCVRGADGNVKMKATVTF